MESHASQSEMVRAVGVRLPKSARVYYFDPGEFSLTRGTRVLVPTEQGEVWGQVVLEARLLPAEALNLPLPPVLRPWSPDDEDALAELREKEEQAKSYARERIAARGLPMRVVDAAYTADGGRLTLYFVADGRVDFRALVHDLTSHFHCRVELRQIGVRDHARLLGGLGPCGRVLCCASFLKEFAPVAIRMAKEQNLSLNPGRISGMCGRLMCCLRYEEEADRSGGSPDHEDGNGQANRKGNGCHEEQREGCGQGDGQYQPDASKGDEKDDPETPVPGVPQRRRKKRGKKPRPHVATAEVTAATASPSADDAANPPRRKPTRARRRRRVRKHAPGPAAGTTGPGAADQ
ncbi:MAG TPA: stage 0 sporulation family protein [Firmicutes bacterium]|nr:stage 0 sporulation family protein [Bacillota bacterium]